MSATTTGRRRARRSWVVGLVCAGLVAAAAGAGTLGAASHAKAAGSTLVFGINNEPPTLDPHVHGSRSAYSMGRQIFDTLVVRSDKTKAFLPELATSWKYSKDGRTYWFDLRKGVTFQDGTPFDAAAVVFNLNRVVNPATKSEAAKDILGPYKSSRALGRYRVQVNFKTTSSPTAVLDALSQEYLGIVSPTAVKKEGKGFGRHPVGTGPYTFKEWVPNDHITLVRNPAYRWGSPLFKHSGPGYLDQIVFRFIPDSATRVAALQSGSIDLDQEVEPTQVANLSKNKDLTIVRGVAPGFPVSIWMNTEAGPLADVNVRRAILYAFDRNTMIKSVWMGQYVPAYGPLSTVSWSYDTNLPKMYPYNPKKAGQILDRAGWKMGSGGIREKNGQKLDVRFFDGGDSRRGEYLQANLKKVGINLIVRIVAFPDLFAVTRKADTYDMASTWFASSDPSVLNILFLSGNVESGYAISRWRSKSLDALLAKGVATVNTAKRAAVYKTIQDDVMRNALLIPMYAETELDGLRKGYTGYSLERGQYPLLYDVKPS